MSAEPAHLRWPRRAGGVLEAEFEGELVLWHEGRLHRLDRVGSLVWSLLDGSQPVADLAAHLATAFTISAAVAARGVRALLGDLDAHQLLAGSPRRGGEPARVGSAGGPFVGPGTRPGSGADLTGISWTHHSGRFLALGHDFDIRSTDAAVGRYLETALGALARPGAARHHYSVVERPHADERYAIYLDDLDLVCQADEERVIRHVLWHVNSEAIRSSDDLVLVHGAGARLGESTLLLPGRINAGKTTLVAGLLLDGFEYLTDELLPIDPVTGLVHPYPRPMNIGEGSWDALARLRPSGPGLVRQQWHINPLDVPDARLADPARPTHVVEPRFVPHGGTRLEELSKPEALDLLFGQMMNLEAHGPEAFHAMVNTVRGARCFRLVLDSLEDGVAVVRALLDGDLHGPKSPVSREDSDL